MCQYQISKESTKVFLLQLGVFSLIISAYTLQSGIRFFLDTFLIYAQLNNAAGLQGIIFFAIFLTAGILLILASKRPNIKILSAAFLLILFGSLWSLIASLNFSFASFDGLLVWSDEISHISQDPFNNVITLATTTLCTAACPCSLTTQILGLAISDTGASKYQDCPSFNSHF